MPIPCKDLSSENITNLVVIQNGCPTAYSERIGLKILNEEKSVGFQFDAFNWKNGGQESDFNFLPDS